MARAHGNAGQWGAGVGTRNILQKRWDGRLSLLAGWRGRGTLCHPPTGRGFPGPAFTYLSFLDLSTHVGRDPQEDMLPAQWDLELADLAQVLGHCEKQGRVAFGASLPQSHAP